MIDSETLLFQLVDDLQDMFTNSNTIYSDTTVKKSMDGDYNISYPLVVVSEIENADVATFYDGKEHIINVGYQFQIYADQTDNNDAETNVICIENLIKNYMRGERYCALQRTGTSPVMSTLDNDSNIKIGYMRYSGRIDIDNNTIYRRY